MTTRSLPIALTLLAAAITPAPASAVIRGHDVPASRYPYMADLLFCGGTLVAPDRVLTAGHCVKAFERQETITLTLGERYESGRKLRVRRHARHPGYAEIGSDLMTRYDVGILELAEPVTDVTPVALATRAAPTGSRVEIVGRGRRSWFGLEELGGMRNGRSLASADLQVISDARCARYYRTNRYKRDFFSSDDMTCALDPARRPSGKRGAPWAAVCVGDSGGPLLHGRGGDVTQVGVVAWGEWCGTRHDPSVFARPEIVRDFALAAAPVWAPVAKEPPRVEGDARPGGQLRCVAPAAWEGPARVTEYLWFERRDSASVPLPKQRSATLDLAAGMEGDQLTCAVFATNAGGTSRSPEAEPVRIR